MHRIFFFGIASLLTCVRPLGGTNPEDIEFRVRLVKETRAYHMGESIKLEIVYSTQSERKYLRSSSSALQNVSLRLMPSDGAARRSPERSFGWNQ